jgi:hypothetical protein
MDDNNDIKIAKRRGRPATGRAKDGKLFIRLPKEQEGPVRAMVEEYLRGGRDSVPAVVVAMVEQPKAGVVEDGKLRKQLEAMTKDYQFYYDRCEELELKVVAANQESEGVAAWTEDEKTKYWRDRAMRCEAALKAKGGEFNQEG